MSHEVPNAAERLHAALAARGQVQGTPERFRACCPAHDDRNPSLSVTRIEGSVLAYCHAGCTTADVLAALGLSERDLYDDPNPPVIKGIPAHAVYRYDNGRRVIRSADKRFRQSNTSQPPELYRLSRVREAVATGRTVFIVEGEKDVHAVEAIGHVATCNPMGAGKWNKIDPSPLYGAREVVIIADRDRAGAQHASDVLVSLKGHVGQVGVFQPKRGKDVADQIAAEYAVEVGQLDPVSTTPTRDDDAWEDDAWEDDAEDVALDSRLVNPPSDPYPNARQFLTEHYHGPEHDYLLHHGGTFYDWTGPYWAEVEDGTLRGELYKFFNAAIYLDAKRKPQPFQPTRHKIADLVDALAATIHLPGAVVPPVWLDAGSSVVASELVSCGNGILHVPSRTLTAHTPQFYVQHAVPFDYNPHAPQPARWLAFLDELWPDDPDAVTALRMMFGYILSGDTRQQKMFMIVGPRRSGKGTIARVLKALVGQQHVAGPTLSSLASNFGLQPLIGKTVAIISDARISEGQTIVIERLLSISGEDLLTVDRKYRDPWTGTLPTRLIVLTNELPRLIDSSGALASRFIMFVTRQSFYGRENPNLTDELHAELPGIFNWALDGIDLVSAAGRLVQPQSSEDAVREMEDLSSPVGAFVRECCMVGPQHRVRCEVLYRRWRDWCADHGRDHPGTSQTFGRDLRAAVLGLKIVQPREHDGTTSRVRMYQGIDLSSANSG